MFVCKFDSKGQYNMSLPRKHERAAVLKLAQQFVAQEETLPAAERTPFYDRVEDLLAQATPVKARAQSGEADRTAASETLKQVEAGARKLVRQVWRMLGILYVDEPAQAEQWGFDVRQTGRGAGNILLPYTRDELIELLQTYTAVEAAKPAEEQFTLVALSEMEAVRDALLRLEARRAQGLNKRVQSIALSKELSGQILTLLKAAATHLLVMRFDGVIQPALAEWGFPITYRRPRGDAAAGETAAAAITAAPMAVTPAAEEYAVDEAEPVLVTNGRH